jgi:hypothetical protein
VLVGNRCPGLEEYHSFESGYCINECDHQCVPPSVLVHIQLSNRKDKHKGRYVSVTALLGCMRQLYLERTLDYFVEPPKSWWSLRGKILHSLLENTQEIPIPDWQSETEYMWFTGLYWDARTKAVVEQPSTAGFETEPIWLYGTIDVLRPTMQEMYDYKTIGDNGLAIIKNGAKKDHIMQFNIYRLLVERGHKVIHDPDGTRRPDLETPPVEIKRIRAYYMTMMQIVGTGSLMTELTDWRVSEPFQHENLVGQPEVVAEKEYLKLKRGKRKENAQPEDYELQTSRRHRMVYNIPEVPLLNLNEVEDFVRMNVPVLTRAFELGEMPPMCSPEMRQWKCDRYCPDQLRQACDSHNLITGEKREVEVQDGAIPVESA